MASPWRRAARRRGGGARHHERHQDRHRDGAGDDRVLDDPPELERRQAGKLGHPGIVPSPEAQTSRLVPTTMSTGVSATSVAPSVG
jgi:hypothetical protein